MRWIFIITTVVAVASWVLVFAWTFGLGSTSQPFLQHDWGNWLPLVRKVAFAATPIALIAYFLSLRLETREQERSNKQLRLVVTRRSEADERNAAQAIEHWRRQRQETMAQNNVIGRR